MEYVYAGTTIFFIGVAVFFVLRICKSIIDCERDKRYEAEKYYDKQLNDINAKLRIIERHLNLIITHRKYDEWIATPTPKG